MKKSFYLLIVIFSLTILSCSKEDELTPDNLAGTIWISDDKESSVEFISKTQFKFKWTDYYGYDEKYQFTENGIYTVNKNNITFDFGDDEPMNGIIDGNSISFVWIGDVIVVIKQ